MAEYIIDAGDVSPTVPLTINHVDHHFQTGVVISPSAAELAALQQSHLSANISLAPLRLTAAPSITGTAQEGQTLTGHHGTYNNTPTGYAYCWKADSVVIDGATSITYVPVTGDVGKVITFEETATDTTGSVTTVSAATAAVIAT